MRKLVHGVLAAASIAALGLAGFGTANAADGGKPTGAPVQAIDDSRAPDRGTGGKVKSDDADRALAKIHAKIAKHVAKNGTAHSFASYVDGTTGQIILDTDAPPALVASLTDLTGAPEGEKKAVREAKITKQATTDNFHRRDDAPSFWGGAGLYNGGFLCSSGYTVKNSAGTRFMVTAGHCFANGATVQNESRTRTYGVVSNRKLPTVTNEPVDMELLGGQTYAGRVYTGGVTSTTSIPVVSAGSAVVGFTNYCHSGRTTGTHCGHTATSISGQTCTQTGCKSPVIVYKNGTMPQGGDSGGAFYAVDASGAYIRGHHISSSSDGTVAYAQPWTTVAAEYGVSVVTG